MTRLQRGYVRSVLAVTFVLCAVSTRAQDARPMVTLSAVPDRLMFPMEEGRNALLTVTVPVKDARQVWLAASATSAGRVMLARTGDTTYQINLADEIVYRVLQANKGQKRFQVFAEDREGQVYGSIAVSYKLTARPGGGKVAVRVWTESSEGVSGEHNYLSRFRCPPFDDDWPSSIGSAPAWLSPGYTKRVGFYCNTGFRASFRAGKKTWPMKPSGETKAYFVLTGDAEKVIRQTRTASVDYVLDDSGRKGTIELKVPPAKLDLPKGWERITIAEYGSSTVPGSGGYLSVRVRNIGSYRTLLTLAGADGRTYIRQTTVKQDSRKVFEYEGRPYVLEVTRLHQSLFGSDYVVLSISPEPPATQKKVDK